MPERPEITKFVRPQRHTSRGTPKCRWCGKALTARCGVRGVMGQGLFHSNACAMQMAVYLVKELDKGEILASQSAWTNDPIPQRRKQ